MIKYRDFYLLSSLNLMKVIADDDKCSRVAFLYHCILTTIIKLHNMDGFVVGKILLLLYTKKVYIKNS